MGLIIVIALVVIVVAVYISMYNGLQRAKVNTDESWSQIDVQLQRRFDLIPNLVETVKGYMIIAEDEMIVIYEGYNKQGFKKFNNTEEIAQELIHTIEKLTITEEMLDEEIQKNEEYEEILNSVFENK